jgi:hypothetical protein
MPETVADRVDFLAFIELAKTAQRDLNELSVSQLNAKLPTDRTGMVMAAIEQRARFEDDARAVSDDEWTIGMLVAQAEWALPRNGEPSATVVCPHCKRVRCICA